MVSSALQQHSSLNQAAEVYGYIPYSEGGTKLFRPYFLRTPEYGTTNKVYYVDLVTGRIATTNAVAKSDDDVCEVGIRPAYVVEQYD